VAGPSVFTPKAIALGCLFAFFVAAGDAYGVFFLRGSYMTLGTSTVGALFLLFILVGFINPLLKLIRPALGLNRGELLLIYAMMVMASPLPTLFSGRFIGTILTPFYYATPENDWFTLIQITIAEWLQPFDPRLMVPFYEGLQQGQPIPWSAWLPLFVTWTPFIWAMFLAMIASMVILRRQWNEHERLAYPLAQVPLALTEQGTEGSRIAPFFKNPVMWIGFSIPAIWGTLHGLHNYFPEAVPVAANVDPIHFILSFGDVSELQFKFRFNILGFFYFLKTEVAFSMWFFNLLSNALRATLGTLGVTSSETLGAGNSIANPILLHQSIGGMLVLFLFGLFAARKHLRQVFRKALFGDPSVDDSGEILSYRAALLILLASTFVMVGWLALAGMPVWVALAFMFIAAALIVGFTRIIAESGLSDGSIPAVPAAVLVSAVGSSAIGAQGLVVLATTYFWTAGVRSFAMTSCANVLKLGEGFGGPKRPLFWMMLLALAIGLGASLWVVMLLSYSYGGLNLKIPGGQFGFYDHATSMIRSPTGPHLWGWVNTAIGAGVMLLLMLARWYYVWWPLHPIGYPISPIMVMDHLWFNMFLAWSIKVIVLRYGGVGLYRKTRPFFMGMILGHIVPGGIFLFIDHFTGMVGNVIFWG